MKKFLLPLVATTLLLTGCSGNGVLDLPSGGTEVAFDEAGIATIADNCGKTAKKTLDTASSGVTANFNLNGSVKVGYKDEEAGKSYHVNVTDFNADISITAGRFFGKTLDQVDAAVTIKNLKGKFDIVTESFSLSYELQPVEVAAYLQDGVAYLDASNSNLKSALPDVLKQAVPSVFKDMTTDQINAYLDTYLGTERKVKYNAKSALEEITIPDIAVAVIPEEVAEAVKDAITEVAAEITLKDYFTVKTYDDGRWGVKLTANKTNIQSLLEKVEGKEEAAEIMKMITTAEGVAVAVTDKYARLESIELQAAVVAANTTEGDTLDASVGAKLGFEYGNVVEFPSGLEQYKDFIYE